MDDGINEELFKRTPPPSTCDACAWREILTWTNLKARREDLRHQQNWPCTCHCRYQRRTSPFLLRPCLHEHTDRKTVGCSCSLESDLLRDTPSSFGLSRTVPDPSWFGLRPFPYVKGLYLRLYFEGPAPSLTKTEHKSRRQHTRFNSIPCMIGCH